MKTQKNGRRKAFCQQRKEREEEEEGGGGRRRQRIQLRLVFANCLGETTLYVPGRVRLLSDCLLSVLSLPLLLLHLLHLLLLLPVLHCPYAVQAVRLLVLIALESKRKRTEKCVKSPNTNVLLKGHSLAGPRGGGVGWGWGVDGRWLNRYTQIEWDS